MFAVGLDPADEGALGFVVQGAVRAHDIPDLGGGLRGVVGSVRPSGWGEFQNADGRFPHFEEGDVFFFSPALEEDDAQTLAAGASGAAAAVEEDFGVAGWIDLDDEVDLGDVEAAGGDVGC